MRGNRRLEHFKHQTINKSGQGECQECGHQPVSNNVIAANNQRVVYHHAYKNYLVAETIKTFKQMVERTVFIFNPVTHGLNNSACVILMEILLAASAMIRQFHNAESPCAMFISILTSVLIAWRVI